MRDRPDILEEILSAKKKRGSFLKKYDSEILKNEIEVASRLFPPLNFSSVLSKPGLSIIAEVKKASPSAGVIREDFDPAKIAKAYKDAGADAISVLTEEDFFLGSPEYLKIVKENAPNIPVLRKDFIYEESQIYESRYFGADSFLLICAMLHKELLRDFLNIGRRLGMEALVETHNLEEIENALDAGAKIIGINNRNLRTFQVDIKISLDLIKKIPDDIVKVSESGIKVADECKILHDSGFNAILVGETFMREGLANFANLIKLLKCENQ